MSLFHRYPNRYSSQENQDEYEREHDQASASQTEHFRVAPRCQVITPLGEVLPAGRVLGVDDLVGGDVHPFEMLRQYFWDGLVTMPQHLDLEDPAIKRVPTRVVDDGKIVGEPAEGWSEHPMFRQSQHVTQRWDSECRVARDRATVRFSVAPGAILPLRDGSRLTAGDEVRADHFRYTEERGLPVHQLARLVRLGLVLEADRPELCTAASPPLDAA